MRNHPQITITGAPAIFGTAHAKSLADLGFFAARFVAAATCRGDVGHGLEGEMIVYSGGGTASAFGVIELNATEENGTMSGLQIKEKSEGRKKYYEFLRENLQEIYFTLNFLSYQAKKYEVKKSSKKVKKSN